MRTTVAPLIASVVCFGVGFAFLGCGNQPDQVTQVAATAFEPLKESEKVREFKKSVASFLVEARAGAKLLSIAPTFKQCAEKHTQITELFTHLPDAPAEIVEREKIASKLGVINVQFSMGEQFGKLANEAVQLGSAELVTKTFTDLKGIGDNIRVAADEIDALIGE